MDRRRRPHQRPAADQQCVGRELGRPMTVGEQREPALAQPVAAACSAWAQAGGSGEQLLDRTDPDQASPSEGGVVDLVPAQAQTGAAGALRRRAELPAGLENEHGLDAGGGARGRHEAPRVGDAFEMDQDGPGRDVQGEVVQNVAQLHLRKLAHGGNAGEADLPRGRPFEHGGGDRIRLGDESEVARRRHHRGRARVELPPRHDHADPIRADQAQPVRSCCRPRRACPLAVERCGAGPAAEQGDGAAAAGGQFAQKRRQVGLRQADHGQARLGRQAGQGLQAGFRGRPAGAAQGLDRPLEPGVPQIGLGDLRSSAAPRPAGPTQRIRSGSNRWRRLRRLMTVP